MNDIALSAQRQKDPRVFLGILCMFTMLGFIYCDGVSVLTQQWIRLEQYWRFLIFIVSVFFVWRQRSEITATAKRPAMWSGAPLLIAGCAAYVFWKISFIDFFIEIGLFLITLGLISLFFGNTITKMLLFPIAYLLLMTSIVDRLMYSITVVMQYASATATSYLLNAMGWEVLRDGRFLRLPHVVLEVASECSGVGQLTALIAFAVPLGLMMHSMLWPRLVLLGLTLPFALVVNVIRIMLIALWNYNGLQSATHGPFELLRMPFIHPLALLFLYLSSLFLLKFEKKKPSLSSSFVNADVPRLALKPRATSIGISIVILTIVSTFFFRANPTHFPHGAEDLPYRAGEWTGETASDSTFSFYLGKPDLLIQRKYDNPMYGPVYVTMARFDHQSARNRISSIVWRRSFDDQHPTDVTVSPSVTIRATIAGTVYNNKNSSTLSWFDIDGASCPTIAEARKKIISTTLKKKRNAATFIAITGYGVSGKAADDAAAAFATAFFQHIQQLLKAAP